MEVSSSTFLFIDVSCCGGHLPPLVALLSVQTHGVLSFVPPLKSRCNFTPLPFVLRQEAFLFFFSCSWFFVIWYSRTRGLQDPSCAEAPPPIRTPPLNEKGPPFPFFLFLHGFLFPQFWGPFPCPLAKVTVTAARVTPLLKPSCLVADAGPFLPLPRFDKPPRVSQILFSPCRTVPPDCVFRCPYRSGGPRPAMVACPSVSQFLALPFFSLARAFQISPTLLPPTWC